MIVQEVIAECGEMSWGQFKPVLTDALIAHLEPIQVGMLLRLCLLNYTDNGD